MKRIAVIFLSILFSLNRVGIVISPSLQFLQQQFFSSSKEEIRFHGYTEENCYVVAVSSSHPIHVKNFDFEIYREEINIPTMGEHFYGLFLTNGSYISGGFGRILSGGKEEKLDYLHFEFGKFNFTYNNIFMFDGYCGGSAYYTEPFPHTLPPGTWYFIFAQGFFDLPQESVKGYISVWINLSDYEGVSFATSEGGNVKFHINNTFVYTFFGFPWGNGFWRIKWIKPDGIETLNMIIIHNYYIPDIFSTGECEWYWRKW